MGLLPKGKPDESGHFDDRGAVPFSAMRRVLWQKDSPVALKFVGGAKEDSEFFRDIVEVREATDHRWPDQRTDTDDYSDHYCLYVNGAPIGSLGVTRALHGPVFMEDYYPAALFEDFRDRIVSAYRFRILSKFRRTSFLARGLNLAYTTIRETWREHIAKGAGIDVINVETKYISYYRRLGYILCEGCDFICPVFHEPISVMFLPTDPVRESIIHDLVQDRDDNVFLADVMTSLTRTQVYIPRRATV